MNEFRVSLSIPIQGASTPEEALEMFLEEMEDPEEWAYQIEEGKLYATTRPIGDTYKIKEVTETKLKAYKYTTS
jgi:hypothetical protein